MILRVWLKYFSPRSSAQFVESLSLRERACYDDNEIRTVFTLASLIASRNTLKLNEELSGGSS